MSGAEHTLAELKREARVRARAIRSSVETAAAVEAAVVLSRRLVELPELRRRGTVLLAYAALPEEIDPAVAVAELAARGLRTAYPRVESEGTLGLHLAHDDDLAEGRFGIREPLPSAPAIDPRAVDVVLVPGVAFDETCHRLGYGGGYYDRLLPRLPHALRVGLAFDEQVVAELPCEEHDIRVDMVLTPSLTLWRPGHPNTA